MKTIPFLPRRNYRLLLLAPLFLMACQSVAIRPPSEVAPQAAQPVTAPATPAPLQVDRVTLEVGVGSPIPVSLRIEGQLNPCAQLSEVRQQFVGTAITLTLNTVQTAQAQNDCQQASAAGPLPFVMNWPLNSVALAAGDYAVTVNGTAAQFAWPAEPTSPTTDEGGVPAAMPGSPDAAVKAIQTLLAQQLGRPETDIELVGAEARDWPDSCLGVGYANELCAAAITPGFQITLGVEGQTYVYHTDPQAYRFRLAEVPEPQVGETFITWSGPTDVEVGACGQAIIGTQGVAFGDCFGRLIAGRYINNLRQNDVAEAATQFASFEIDTTAGRVQFTGKGTEVASPVKQRQIAEWAKQLFLEARAGRTSAALGQVAQLDQANESAQTCTTIAVHITGEVMRANCDGSGAAAATELTEDQLAQLYTWVDTFGVFETPAPNRLVFGGRGGQEPTEADQKAIFDFLAGL